jgi:hypothetical protein
MSGVTVSMGFSDSFADRGEAPINHLLERRSSLVKQLMAHLW